MSLKPNIFKIATSELTQDGFFTWLLQWADNSVIEHDKQLSEAAKDFVRLLIGESTGYNIQTVRAGRQWRNIDIWAEVNGEYFVAIEDKTDTCAHSDQLRKYKQISEEYYRGKDFKLVFIYLKTGNESSATLKEILEKGYTVIGRKAILDVLLAREVENDIFTDFTAYLVGIEAQTNAHVTIQDITSDRAAAEGFYIKLQERIEDWTHWRYVSNRAGGFWGFWYHWVGTKDHNLYIQVENYLDCRIKLVIKIDDWKPSVGKLYTILAALQPYADKYGLRVMKPTKYSAGATSTVAVIPNAFVADSSGNFDFERFIDVLTSLERILDKYSTDLRNCASSIAPPVLDSELVN